MTEETNTPAPDSWGCTLKELPAERRVEAAEHAIEQNELNRPDANIVAAAAPAAGLDRPFIAMLTSKYWGTGGVNLTVSFLDTPPRPLRAKILEHMNAWGKSANVRFREEADANRDTADVRIARARDGHWSYLGTDIKLIPPGKPTMNLQEFTMETPESEFYRVVRHETGHTLGCPHEHLRKELVDLIDVDKAVEYFGRTQGWNAEQVHRQVLTPIDQKLIKSSAIDQQSIMCYQIPGSITKTGKPIAGGLDIDKIDYDFMALMYPKPAAPKARAAAESHEHAAAAAADRRVAFDLSRGDLKVAVYEPVEAGALRELMQALG